MSLHQESLFAWLLEKEQMDIPIGPNDDIVGEPTMVNQDNLNSILDNIDHGTMNEDSAIDLLAKRIDFVF